MELRELLERVQRGEATVEEALEKLKILPFEDLGFAKLDHHRRHRQGFPEVIFCPGKTVEQVATLFERLATTCPNVLATRATPEMATRVLELCPDAVHDVEARVIYTRRDRSQRAPGRAAVIAAGTSDRPVAREASLTLEVMGHRVSEIHDVGVAGLHRLLDKLPDLLGADVLVVVAGMEGALPSVVGGLVSRPVIAVPTSVGYGASFQGLAALLAMLNSCASGILVVNIDNGFGAATAASRILMLGARAGNTP